MNPRSLYLPLLVSGLVCAAARAQYAGPAPYLSFADSPFAVGSFSYFHLENFEDESLTPGLIATGGTRAGPGPFTDSVDGDDGAIDGSGALGGSYLSVANSTFEFRFDAGVLGAFPTHAGMVWTDVGAVTAGFEGFSEVRFEAFDAAGISLGGFGPFILGDGTALSATAEDRFLGIVNAAGISRIVITMPNSTDWEVDHVQYGLIPTPGAALVLLGLPLLRRRAR
jgi:hypothetical protein